MLEADPLFDLEIIAFGTHVSNFHGFTLNNIVKDGFKVAHTVESMLTSDSPEAISTAIGLTQIKFAALWAQVEYDIVFCLGDRYEMFAAVTAGIPFQIKFAHLHGGETTLGAIDNTFRHCLTLSSVLHFVSTEAYAQKVIDITGSSHHVHQVGALSIDNLSQLHLLSIDEFRDLFAIDLSVPTILITFHPETVESYKNEEYIQEIISALSKISDYQFLITMPNADTQGTVIRRALEAFILQHPMAFGVESLGTIGYLSAMKYCSFLLGNTSSGFVEASFFPKLVLNLGSRQEGRLITPNIRNVRINEQSILEAVREVSTFDPSNMPLHIYGDGQAASKIIKILKDGSN